MGDDRRIISPMPNDDQKKSEANVENAPKVVKERMEALETGAVSKEQLQEAHRLEIAEGNKNSTYPTMIIDLPSKGLLYPENNTLSLGSVEMKFMTAKEEDILTTESYIKKGVVLDKLFQSLIVSKIDYDSMLIGDRDAIMIAARIYGYGEIYESKVQTPSGDTQTVSIDLNDIPHKKLDEDLFSDRQNVFFFTTNDGTRLEYKLLCNKDQKEIQVNLKKVRRGDSRDTQLTTRLFQMIQAVDDNRDRKFIKAWIENDFRAIDSRKVREEVNRIQPGIEMAIEVVDEETSEPFRTSISLGLDFFWTDI